MLPFKITKCANLTATKAVQALKFLFYLYLGEGLDDVANLDVVVVDERDTALQTCCHFLHVILVTLQGSDRSGMHHDSVAYDMCLILGVYLALGHETTGDRTDLGYLEHLLDLHFGGDDLLLHLVEHADHGSLDIRSRRSDRRPC